MPWINAGFDLNRVVSIINILHLSLWFQRCIRRSLMLLPTRMALRAWKQEGSCNSSTKSWQKSDSDCGEKSNYPDNKVHGANIRSIWGRQDPGEPHVGPMNLAIWVPVHYCIEYGGNGISYSNIYAMCRNHRWIRRWLVAELEPSQPGTKPLPETIMVVTNSVC